MRICLKYLKYILDIREKGIKEEENVEKWYFVTKIVLTYYEKKLAKMLGFRKMQEKLEI